MTTYDVGVDLSTIYSVYEEGETTYTYVPSYELPSNYETWVSETKAAIIADMDFDNPSCVDAGVCDPSFYVSKEPEEAPFDVDLSMNISKARYRFGIPLGYTRSVWVMQWDEAFFPDGHDDTIDVPVRVMRPECRLVRQSQGGFSATLARDDDSLPLVNRPVRFALDAKLDLGGFLILSGSSP